MTFDHVRATFLLVFRILKGGNILLKFSGILLHKSKDKSISDLMKHIENLMGFPKICDLRKAHAGKMLYV